MLRSVRGEQGKAVSRSCHLLVFSVGGRQLAVKTEEVAGLAGWKGSIPIPSRTPYVSAVVRQDAAVVPVFSLAEFLRVTVQGDELLCLTAKHRLGAMAICIDAAMPALHTIDPADMKAYRGNEFAAVGMFVNGLDEIPIISLAQLGSA
jgi:chemotaxis signal transduction protein